MMAVGRDRGRKSDLSWDACKAGGWTDCRTSTCVGSDGPAIDINVPGLMNVITKIHFGP